MWLSCFKLFLVGKEITVKAVLREMRPERPGQSVLTVPPRQVNRRPLYSLITIYRKWKTLKWNCGFWSTWSKNIWSESDEASTKSSVMCHSHILNLCQTVKISLCFRPQSPFGQLYVRSRVAFMLCRLHSVFLFLYHLQQWISGRWAASWPSSSLESHSSPEPTVSLHSHSFLCVAQVQCAVSLWVQMEQTDAHWSFVFKLSIVLTAVHVCTHLLMTAEALFRSLATVYSGSFGHSCWQTLDWNCSDIIQWPCSIWHHNARN